MLVLTRRVGESIQIGDDVTITVVEQKGGHIRLGIEAPQTIDIKRGELLDRQDQSTDATATNQSKKNNA